jgi:hypothetical protein
MKILKSVEGVECVVDDLDYEWAKDIKWKISQYGYFSYRNQDDRIFLHRLISAPSDDLVVDHINGNKLDNLRSNLRNISQKENFINSKVRSDNNSGYRGVSYRKDRGTYSVEIAKDGKKIRLGCYKTAREGALVYNQKAKELYGDKAWLNDIK